MDRYSDTPRLIRLCDFENNQECWLRYEGDHSQLTWEMAHTS
jgi:hypothetical protein